MIYIAHILGIFAVITFLISFQFKTRKNILIVNILSRSLYILQYIFLGAFEGAVLDFLGLVFSFFARYKDKPFFVKHFKIIMVIINLILLTMGFLMYENIFSLFAIGGIVFEVIALWLTKEKNIRILSLIAAPCWLIYNFKNAAYGSVVGNILGMISIITAIIRLDLNKKGKNI